MQVIIDPNGTVRCLYTEALDLAAFGVRSIRRASHVEPGDSGGWWADLAPVGGPRLGPFARRSEALAGEQRWLEAHGPWTPHAPRPRQGPGVRTELEV